MSQREPEPIHLDDVMPIPEEERRRFKLHLASWNGKEHPLDVYVTDRDRWLGWNRWRGNRNDWTRKYIFSLIDFYHERDKWLFGGVFEVTGRLATGYEIRPVEKYERFNGRLMLDLRRYQGMRGRAFYLERYYGGMTVSDILRRPYDGRSFPGFENVHVPFSELEHIIHRQRKDWHAALKNVKGVYVVFDAATGKKYVGSAYGDTGVWARWSGYVKSGHGWNDELVALIGRSGLEYVRKNFQFCLLEHVSMRSSDDFVIRRETYWKEVLLSRGEYGYNKN